MSAQDSASVRTGIGEVYDRRVSVAEHRKAALTGVRCAVLTVSDTRALETDVSGRTIVELLEAAGHVVRVFIDRPGPAATPEESVSVEDCEQVNRELGTMLDVEDPLPGSYTLEVSSPGFDRRLRTPAHFERFVGERVRIELRDALEGRRNFTGTLTGVEGSNVLLEVDGEAWKLPLNDIAVARLVPA